MSCWMSSSRLQTTLTGPSTCCAILDGEHGAVDVEPPAEAAAQQMVVDPDRVLRQAGELRRPCACVRVGACVPTQMSQPSLRDLRRCSSSAPSPHGRGTASDRWRRCAAPRRRTPCRRRRRCAPPRRAACDASSSCWTMSALLTVAFGPSSHWMAAASSPFLAAPRWSATTATALSMRTTWRTPLTASAAASSTDFGLPPNTGEMAIAAIPMPGSLVSMPYSRGLHLVGRVQPLRRRADQGEVLRVLQRHAVGRRHRQGGRVSTSSP